VLFRSVLVACEDITERKRAEEELEQTQQRLRAVIANAPIILFALDGAGVFTLSEGRGLDALGLRPGEVVGRSVSDMYRDAPHVLASLRRALAGEALTEVVEVNGQVFETHYVPVLGAGGQVVGVNGVAINITERRRAEEALRQSEGRYRYIFQAAGVSIWEEDFTQVKAAVDELKAGGVGDFQEYLAEHPEFVRRAVPLVRVGDVNDATVKLFGAGSKEELLGSLDRVFLPETEEVFAGELAALAEGRPSFEAETVLRTLEGDRLTVIFTITFPPAPAGLDSVLVTITDITERKRAEEALQKAQAELAHVARVTTMGELTSSIAHEVNQPLAAIVTNANAALRWLAVEPPNLDEAREAVGRIVRDGHRASEVIGRVRALFRKTATDKARLDINHLAQESIALVRGELRRNRVVLRTELAHGLPPVLGDRVQLQQVLLNLIINAVEAMSAVAGRPRELLVSSRRDESGGVIVSVRDSGLGLDPESAERLFDAFYTTKPEGMGMGLSVSRSIIEAHGGRLWAASDGRPGATFQFSLPAGGGGGS
jgi:PAS domain S-box-containing protein